MASAKLASVLASRKSRTARFALFEADLEARELRKQGRTLRLQGQPFSLLAILIEHAGTVVTRDELRTQLWPADTFVDFDHSLNTAVNKLREVLGDSASSPLFIATVARRGYRFIPEVQWESQANDTVDPPDMVAQTTSPADGLPIPRRAVSRALFALIQLMYLIFYLEAVTHAHGVEEVSFVSYGTPWIWIAVLVSAAIGIPVRLYLLSADAFDYPGLGAKFHRIFWGVFLLDELWAIAPFLIVNRIGFAGALAATAALLYVPFAERTLVRMAYSQR